MIYTTLNKIRNQSPCAQGWRTLLKHLGESAAASRDAPLGFDVIIESNGIKDAVWCMQTLPEEFRRFKHLAARLARALQPIIKDRRIADALDVAQRHADGLATRSELQRANLAAVDAFRDAPLSSGDWAAAGVVAAATMFGLQESLWSIFGLTAIVERVRSAAEWFDLCPKGEGHEFILGIVLEVLNDESLGPVATKKEVV